MAAKKECSFIMKFWKPVLSYLFGRSFISFHIGIMLFIFYNILFLHIYLILRDFIMVYQAGL